MKKPPPRTRNRVVKLYVDDKCEDAVWAKWTDAKKAVDVIVPASIVETSRRGLPWICVASNGVKHFAEKNPDAFPHKVLMAYTVDGVMYIIDRKAMRFKQHHHAVRYEHNFTKGARRFDSFTPQQFLDTFGDYFIIHLKPPRYRGKPGRRGAGRTHGLRVKMIRRGARRRAEDAGLIPLQA